MQHVSIYWENDSDELLDMMQELNDPGETVGNDGAEMVVTDSELQDIREYAADHPGEIRLEQYGELSQEKAQQKIEDWKDTVDPEWRLYI